VVGRVSERVAWHYVYGMSEALFTVFCKHVELILEINKTVIVASSWCSIFTYVYDRMGKRFKSQNPYVSAEGGMRLRRLYRCEAV
jgi:hypothetical protein